METTGGKLRSFLMDSFTVVGRAKYLKLDFALAKVARFIIGGDERHIISEVGIDAYNALPCYCPLLVYKVALKMIPNGCGIYRVERVFQCDKRYPDGIPLKKLLSFTTKYGSKKFKLGGTLDKLQSTIMQREEEITPVSPIVIKSKRDIQNIEYLDDQTKLSLIKLCNPCFRSEVFFDLICYFPYSFLKRYTDNELEIIRQRLMEHPPLACFRVSFNTLLKKITQDQSISETLSVDNAQYSLNRWMYFTAGEEQSFIEYCSSCPLWNIQMMIYFCKDHNIENEEMLPLIRMAIFIYIACERSKAMKGITSFEKTKFKMTQEIVNYFTEQNIMVSDGDDRVVYSHDKLEQDELMELYRKIKSKVEFVDIQTNVDEMIDITLHSIIKEQLIEELRETIIVTPHFSNSLYLQAKLERGFDFQREKPKRGRKKKIQDIDVQKVEIIVEQNPSNIYDIQTWLKLLKRTDIKRVYKGCKHFIVWCTQEMTISNIIEILSFIDEDNNEISDLKHITIIGNTSMWTHSVSPVFNVFAKRMNARVISSKTNHNRYRDLFGMFLDNVTMKKKQKLKKNQSANTANQRQVFKCSHYENEELLSEFLNEWMNEKNAKWKSKTILFTNEQLMQKISIGTNEHTFRLGTNSSCLYIDSTIFVEQLGMYGIVKKATVLSANYVWRDVIDQSVPLFPFNHRYILRVEDYYTKYIRLIDTSKYICRNPLFSLVKTVPAIPFEIVLLIIDHTTTKQDIARAAEISSNIFTVYYKKGLNISSIINHEMIFPETSLDCKLKQKIH